MPTREIKTRFALEGEQQFKNAMKNSANAIKVLNSEQKLAKAQFQQTGDAEKYAAQQAEILKKKIEEQKAAVAAAEEAIKQLSQNGVAENSRQMQQWKIRLNDAQTSLAKMETELQNVGAESTDASEKTEELGDSLASIDKKASLATLVSSVDRLSAGLGTALIKVNDLAQGLVKELRDAAGWADDLATTALIYGMDPETLQRMQYASQLVDTDVNTIISSRQKLEQAMKSARPSLNDEEIKQSTKSVNEYEKAFAQLGVEIMRYGQYRNWEDVFWEAGDALMHMTDGLDGAAKANAEIVRDTTAQQLFGKSWRELLPLFTAGREGYAEAMNEAAVVSQEDVDKLTELDDALVKLQNQFDVLEKTVLAQLSPTLTDLSNALSNLLKEFNEYLQSEEGQKMLTELGSAINELFSDLANTDFSSALGTAKDALQSVVEALNWLKNNKDSVVTAIGAVVGAWGALKVTSGVATMLQLINGLKGLHLPGASAASGAAQTAGSGGAAVAGGAAPSIFSRIGPAVGNIVSSGVGDILGTATMAAIAIGDKTEAGRTLRDGGSWQDALSAAGKEFENWQRQVAQNAQTFWDDWTNLFTGQNGPQEETPTVPVAPDLENLSPEEIERQLQEHFGTTDPIKLRIMMEANPNEAPGSDGYWSNGNPVDTLKQEVEEAAPNLNQSMNNIGGNASSGLANGINARAGEAISAAQALADAVAATIRAALQIASPSRIMMSLGEYVGQGFAEGIESQLGLVNQAAERMAGAVEIDPGAGSGSSSRVIDVTLMVGPDQLAQIMVPLVNDSMGEEISLMRR